jgi:hypothetical protein
VFEPLDKVGGTQPGAIYKAFSEEELRDLLETVGWLKAAYTSFEFWDNQDDAVDGSATSSPASSPSLSSSM